MATNPSSQIKSAKENQILRKGSSFTAWREMLEAALVEKDCLGYVMHDIQWETPIATPVRAPAEPSDNWNDRMKEYNRKDTIARGIILSRLAEELRPNLGTTRKTAKQLYDIIETTYQPVITMDLPDAIKKLNSVKLTGQSSQATLTYCELFQSKLQNFQVAVEQYAKATKCKESDLALPKVYINVLFEAGTYGHEWLRSWRHANRPETTSLETMITTLRREQPPEQLRPRQNPQFRMAGAAKITPRDDGEQCEICTHHQHTNARCFIQHPELDTRPPRDSLRAPSKRRDPKSDKKKNNNWRKGKGKKAAAAVTNSDENTEPEPDSEDEVSDGTSGAAIVAMSSKNINSNSIMLDSGTSYHFFNNRSYFSDLSRRDKPVSFSQAIGHATCTHSGTVTITMKNKKGEESTITMSNCLYSPHSSCNLISAGKLWLKNKIELHRPTGGLLRKGKKIGWTKIQCNVDIIQDVTILQTQPRKQKQPTELSGLSAPAVARPKADTERWHQRLGHVGSQILSATKAKALGLETIDTSTLDHCEVCKLSKSQRVVSRRHRAAPGQPLDEIHVDTIGPITPTDIHENQYIYLLTDARTRYRWAIMASDKRHGPAVIQHFITEIKNAYGKTPKMWFSDGGGEYVNTELTEMAQSMGMRWDISAPHTPEQNGTAEASNKVILAKARAMMIDAGLPPNLWFYAAQYSCYVTNHMANLSTKQIPIQQLDQELKLGGPERIDLSNIRRFGCKAFLHIQTPVKSAKFAPRAQVCWFLGFQKNSSTNYVLWLPVFHPETQQWTYRITWSPHVAFDEATTYGSLWHLPWTQQSTPQVQGESVILNNIQLNSLDAQEEEESPKSPQSPLDAPSEHHQTEPTPTDQGEYNPDQGEPNTDQEESQIPIPDQNDLGEQNDQALIQESRNEIPDHIQQSANQEVQLPQPEAETPQDNENEAMTDIDMFQSGHSILAGRKRIRPVSPPPNPEVRQSRYGRNFTQHDYKRLNKGAAAISNPPPDPKDLYEALRRPDAIEWKAAMRKELKSLESTGTIEWIKASQLPRGRKPLTGKWVYKIKYLPDGSIEKYKARWTARGFSQRFGADYTKTYAPTPRAASGRVLLGLCLHLNWKRKQIDVETAFLHPNIDKKVCIRAPDGISYLMTGKDSMYVKVNKGLYGLKQSANLWHHDASETMIALGLKRTQSDACLFIGKGVIVLIHVDDLQIFSPDEKRIDWFIDCMRKKYPIKVIDTDVFLGLHIQSQGDDKVKISQKHYALDKLRGHQLDQCKPVKYPLDHVYEKLEEPCSCTKEDYDLFNKMIGELQHLSNHTRPDITFAVNHLAKFLQNPGPQHVTAARHVWKYIKGTIETGLVFQKKRNLKLEVYSDSDFAGDPSSSKSTTGSLIKLAGAPVIWKSQLQREVTLSSTEAEYVALSETVREVCWLRNLLAELRPFTNEEPGKVKIFVDNLAAISLTEDHANSKRSRHISLRNHYCREKYEQGIIEVEYINTTEQLADALTKPKSPNPLL